MPLPAVLAREGTDGYFAHPSAGGLRARSTRRGAGHSGPPYPPVAIPRTDRALWMRVIRHARCAGSSLDPDQWFPVSVEIGKARQEAAAAITVCTTCLVRAECLALSLRHPDIGQHGVWGGLVAAERAALARRRHATVLSTGRAPLADGESPCG